MSLLTRLVDPQPGEEKIPVHQFMAAVSELKRGAPGVTVATIASTFELSASEETELEAFVSTYYTDGINRGLIHDVLMLGEGGQYSIEQCEDRLIDPPIITDLWPLITHRAFQVVARGLNDCVLRGCLVSAQAQPDMTLAVAEGAVLTNDSMRSITAANVNVSAAHATLPRIDLLVIDSSGAKVVRAGTPSSGPTPPQLSSGDVCLAFFYIKPGDTAIPSSQILDTRMVRTTGPVVIAKLATPVVRNNTSAAETFFTLPIPRSLLVANRHLRIRCGGTMLLNSGTPTVTIRLAFNGTTLFQDPTGAATADADRLAWELDFVLTGQGNSDQSFNGRLAMSPVAAKTAPTTGIGDISVASALVNPIAGSSAVDVTGGDRDLILQFQMSVANAANEIAMEYAFAELI